MTYFNKYLVYYNLLSTTDLGATQSQVKQFIESINLVPPQWNNYKNDVGLCIGLDYSTSAMLKLIKSLNEINRDAGKIILLAAQKCVELKDLLELLKKENKIYDDIIAEMNKLQVQFENTPSTISKPVNIKDENGKLISKSVITENKLYYLLRDSIATKREKLKAQEIKCTELCLQIDLIINVLKQLNVGDYSGALTMVSTQFNEQVSSNILPEDVIPEVIGYSYQTFELKLENGNVYYSVYVPQFIDGNYKPQILLHLPGSNQMDYEKGKKRGALSQLEKMLGLGTKNKMENIDTNNDGIITNEERVFDNYYTCPYIVVTIRGGTNRSVEAYKNIMDEIRSEYKLCDENGQPVKKDLLFAYSFGTHFAPSYIEQYADTIDYAVLGGPTEGCLGVDASDTRKYGAGISLQSLTMIDAIKENNLKVTVTIGSSDPNVDKFREFSSLFGTVYNLDESAKGAAVFMDINSEKNYGKLTSETYKDGVAGYGGHGNYNEQYVATKYFQLIPSNSNMPSKHTWEAIENND